MHPSLDGIAFMASVCKQTVVNCLKGLELYGFVVVHRRIKRVRTPLGFKTVQDTNAYTIQEPQGLGALAVSMFRKLTESRKLAASSSFIFHKKGERLTPPPSGVPDGVFPLNHYG